MTVVAIHQPTFLPWLGWWDKLVRADVFVLLDDVQFPKKGGTWINRVRLLVNGDPRWVTVPVDRTFHGTRTVREMRIDRSKPWRDEIVGTIRGSYARAAFAAEVLPVLEEALDPRSERIADLNERAIQLLAERLEFDLSKLVRQSEVGVSGTGTQLLVDLCRAVGGDTYLSGDGADEYLEEDSFDKADLGLEFQDFTPPLYQQGTQEHVPGLSVVDALANCGWRATAELIVRAS